MAHASQREGAPAEPMMDRRCGSQGLRGQRREGVCPHFRAPRLPGPWAPRRRRGHGPGGPSDPPPPNVRGGGKAMLRPPPQTARTQGSVVRTASAVPPPPPRPFTAAVDVSRGEAPMGRHVFALRALPPRAATCVRCALCTRGSVCRMGSATRALPVQRRAVCRSQRTSTRQHKKSRVSGTIGALHLRSPKRLDQLRTHRDHSVKPTPAPPRAGADRRHCRTGPATLHGHMRHGAVLWVPPSPHHSPSAGGQAVPTPPSPSLHWARHTPPHRPDLTLLGLLVQPGRQAVGEHAAVRVDEDDHVDAQGLVGQEVAVLPLGVVHGPPGLELACGRAEGGGPGAGGGGGLEWSS